MMPRQTRSGLGPVIRASISWTAVALCVAYGLFAFTAAIAELLAILGLMSAGAGRAAPPLFIAHALTGGLALTSGALQLKLSKRLLVKRRALHRRLGRVYAAAAGATSLSGLVTAAAFDIGPFGKAAFAAWSMLWLATTIMAVRRARSRRFASHRLWMFRSFAMGMVFVTFSLLQPMFAAAGLSRAIGYPLAVSTSVLINVSVAQLWCRNRYSTRRPSTGGLPRTEPTQRPAAIPAGET